MPWPAVEKEYAFDTPRGRMSLLDLFEGRRQLAVYRAFYEPGVSDIERLKARMGWTMPWVTLLDDFDADFGVDEWHGTNAFLREGDRVFRTYFVNARGDEALGSTFSYLDMTALGRQEDWEDSPEGYPQTPPYVWWDWRDEYTDAGPTEGWLEKVAEAEGTLTSVRPTAPATHDDCCH